MNTLYTSSSHPEPLPLTVRESSESLSHDLNDMSEELGTITRQFTQLHTEGRPHPLEAGRMLLQAKQLLGHGNFLTWLAQHFRLSAKSANRLMSVALLFQRLSPEPDAEALFMQLDNSALYELAAKSTPEEIQYYVLSLLRAGEAVTYSDIRLLKGQPQIRHLRDRAVVMRFMGLLEAFKIWFEKHHSELKTSFAELDEQARHELIHYADNLRTATKLLDTLLTQKAQDDLNLDP